jgi:hypothetical protein
MFGHKKTAFGAVWYLKGCLNPDLVKQRRAA